MGIQNFLPLFKEVAGIKAGSDSLLSLRGQTVGVDASVWMVQCLQRKVTMHSLAIDYNAVPPLDLSGYIYAFMDEKKKFFDGYNITLLLVFDSVRNPLKKEENEKRGERSRKAKEALDTLKESNSEIHESALFKVLKALVHPRPDVFAALYQWGLLNNVSCRAAPFFIFTVFGQARNQSYRPLD